ncbi:MAG: hypothetical protein RL701_3353 [Pseudomonadota bacterium]
MKVIKPLQLSVLTRPYEFRREFKLGVSVLAFVPMGNERGLIPEVAMWPIVAEQMGGSPMLDACIPKSKAEYLVVGSVHAPGEDPTPQCTVMAEVAGRKKLLVVSGDRQWHTSNSSLNVASAPIPFKTMPLTWSRAFGGGEYPRNPDGRGYLPEAAPSPVSHLLPNLEYAPQRVVRRRDQPEPANYGPVDQAWQPRAGRIGTHDAAWLKDDFPGFARDIPWEFFNIAPADQWFDESFAHDAPYELYNMHPTRASLPGRLPSLRPRCFVQRAGRDVKTFSDVEEVALAQTTLWFFPSIERIAIVFHGQVKVLEDDASDLTHLVVAVEDAKVPERRELDYYRAVIARRCDLTNGALYALKDSELCPPELMYEGQSAETAQADTGLEGLARKRLKRRMQVEVEGARAKAVALGLDPDVYAPPFPQDDPPPPSLEELPEFLAKLEAEAEQEKQKRLAEQVERDAANARLFEEQGLDFAAFKEASVRAPGGPPSFTVRSQVAELERIIAGLAAQGQPTDFAQNFLDDPQTLERWTAAESGARTGYKRSAHLQTPAPARSTADDEARTRLREHVQALAKQPNGLVAVDLTGADLSEMKLDGVNFEGAFLESVNFTKASLRGAKLRGAVLAHAQLAECDLSEADLHECNLGSSHCVGTNFCGALLSGTVLAKANLSKARFTGARLENTDLAGATLHQTCFAQISAEQLSFIEIPLRAVDFTGAKLLGCNLLKCDLEGAVFREATLDGTLFLECKGRCDFRGAHMRNVRMLQGCIFDNSQFDAAQLPEANLRGTSLIAVSMRGANLDGADLEGAQLKDADLQRVHAHHTNLSRTDLRNAQLKGANLMYANLKNAHLEGADFSHTNLFGADLARIRIDHESCYDAVLFTRARLHPQHVPHDLGKVKG